MKLEISVTEEDIKNGRAGEYSNCAIALALKKLGCTEINVDTKVTKLTLNGLKYSFKTPKEVGSFIDDYDDKKPVKPIKFCFEQPSI